MLGAGSSGLGAALGVSLNSQEKDVWVLEKKILPGGLAGSFVWNENIVDYGPHRLSPNLLSTRVLVEELLGPECIINKSQHGVQFKGRLYQFPPRVVDFLSPKAWYLGIVFGLSFMWAKFTWLIRRFRRDSFETTMVSKFGKKFHDEIVAPMAEKVWIAPGQIDPSFVNQRFALIQPLEVIKKVLFPKQELNPSSFYYPRKGFQQLWDNLSDYLERDGQHLLYDCLPTKIEVVRNRIVAVTYQRKGVSDTITGENLEVVSTIPIIKLLEIIHGFDTAPLLDAVKKVKFKSMILVALEFNRPKALPFRTLIFPEKEFWFNRLFEQNEYSRETVSQGKSVIVADVTPPRGDMQMKLSDDEIVQRVVADLKKLSYIPLREMNAVHVERVEFAYVVPDLETRRAFHFVQHELKKIRNLFLMGRFSSGEYDNSDYALDSGLTLGATLSGRASRLEYLYATHSKRGRSIVG